MIKKEYTARGFFFSTSIDIDGRRKRIEFHQGYRIGAAETKARYSTTNEQIQYALEHSRSFGTLYFLTNTEIEAEPAKTEPKKEEVRPTEPTVVEEVTTMKEAIAYLTSEPYNLKTVQCNSKPKLALRLKELNIEFPNIVYDL